MKKNTNMATNLMKVLMYKAVILFVLLLSFQATHAQWKAVNNPSLDVCIVDQFPNTIFTTSSNGIIRKSVDSGVSWEILNTSVSEDLSALDFFNKNHGIATMPNVFDSLLVTKDGGVTWEKQWFNAEEYGIRVNDVCLLKDGTGFVFGNGYVFKTTDYGTSWILQDQALLTGRIEKVNGDTLVHFSSRKQGLFLKYFAIDISTDRGNSWEQVSINPAGMAPELRKSVDHFKSVHFIDSKHFFITSSKDEEVSVTDDGGINFIQLSGNFRQNPTDMFFKNRNEGIILSEYGPTAFKTADGGLTLNDTPLETFKTDQVSKIISLGTDSLMVFTHLNTNFFSPDFGETWEKRGKNLITTSNVRILDIKFWSDTDLKASYSIVRNNIVEEAGIIQSIDGGATWNAVNTELHFTMNEQNAVSLFTPDSIAYVDGFDYRLSKDGGKTFTNHYLGQSTAGTPTVLHAFTPDNLYLTHSNGQTFLSSDKGASWEKVSAIHGGGYIHSVTGIDSNSAYALASLKVFRMSDMGRTYTDISNGINLNNTRNIDLLNDKTTLIISGYNGVIWRSTDAGANWVNLKDSMPTDIRNQDWTRLIKKNDSVLYLISDGKIAISTNKGRTWDQDRSLNGCFAMDWLNETEAIAISTYGTAFRWYPTKTEIVTSTASFSEFESKTERFFPNPVLKGIIYFQKASSGELYTLNGRQIKKFKDFNHLNVSDLQQGIYILKLNGSPAETLIIQ